MATKKKNSLVANINRRRKAGKSRSVKKSTVSGKSYKEMQAGWPHSKTAKRKKAKRKSTARKTTARRKTAKRKKS